MTPPVSDAQPRVCWRRRRRISWQVLTDGECVSVQEQIVAALVRGLQTCPDVVSMRRELLIATRHALTTSLKA